MADGYQPLTAESLQTSGGVVALNEMLRFLFEKVLSVGDDVDISYGYGSPENNVTKAVGSLYVRLDGGASTTLYVKESGSADTGWAAK